MDFSSIKNIVFDLGGVIINLDFKKTYDAFAELGGADAASVAEELKSNRLFDIHGNGDLSDDEFRSWICDLLKVKVSDAKLDEAFNALLCDIPIERIRLLQNLSRKYRLFLLSNTNFIHINKVNEILFQCSGLSDLKSLFEKVYYSHEMKLSKPEVKIYRQVLEENNLVPSETLFIDDIEENTKGAEKAGMKAICVTSPQTILEIFEHAL